MWPFKKRKPVVDERTIECAACGREIRTTVEYKLRTCLCGGFMWCFKDGELLTTLTKRG